MAVLYALLTVLMIPGSAVTLACAALFGFRTGFLVVVAGSNAGALAAFLLGRTLLRRRVEAWASARPGYRGLDRAVGGHGFKIVALLRLSPVFPFVLLNYLLGLTSVRTGSYVLANVLGMLPGTFLYVYAGSLAGEAVRTDWGLASSRWKFAFRIVGLAATLGVTLWITRLAKKAFAEAEKPPA
jgi:uncharacterized membrane protein YdjX (TVP38/TMEM64 family)